MRAVALVDFVSGLAIRELVAPVPGVGEVLVRVEAASVNRVDVLIAAGALRGVMEYEFPVVPGRDFAGVVERIGAGVADYGEGDEVTGWITSPTLHDGTWAEYVVAPAGGSVARRPPRLGVVEAAALPLAGMTAFAAVEAVAPGRGDVVLVAGAGGGVGSFAVQLAARRGADVVATAAPGDEVRLAALGAAETVAYLGVDVGAAVRERHPDGVDGLIDLVSGEAVGFEALAVVVRDGGRAVSTLGAASAAGRDIAVANVMADPADPATLERLAALAASGELTVSVESVYPVEDVEAAIAAFARGKRGKIALRVSDG
jgi:NADPH:quinone reductase-like Zn-dependent oxidoreductase